MATTEATASDVQIRWMIRRDIPDVLQIESLSFEFPWTEEDFLCWLRNRNVIGQVAELNGQVVGFFVYELHKKSLHILNLAVHPEYRRKGVGSRIVEKLTLKLSQQRRTELTTEVRESNLSAQLFFKASGFLASGVVKGQYEDTDEDAYQFFKVAE